MRSLCLGGEKTNRPPESPPAEESRSFAPQTGFPRTFGHLAGEASVSRREERRGEASQQGKDGGGAHQESFQCYEFHIRANKSKW